MNDAASANAMFISVVRDSVIQTDFVPHTANSKPQPATTPSHET
jgi:hypothetical protein